MTEYEATSMGVMQYGVVLSTAHVTKRLNTLEAQVRDLQDKLAAVGEELLTQKSIADKATELLSEKVGFSANLVRQRLRNNYYAEAALREATAAREAAEAERDAALSNAKVMYEVADKAEAALAEFTAGKVYSAKQVGVIEPIVDAANARADKAEAALAVAREAVSGLLNKLEETTAASIGIYVFAEAHGVKYDGPTYEAEEAAVRAALDLPTGLAGASTPKTQGRD